MQLKNKLDRQRDLHCESSGSFNNLAMTTMSSFFAHTGFRMPENKRKVVDRLPGQTVTLHNQSVLEVGWTETLKTHEFSVLQKTEKFHVNCSPSK